MRPQQTEGPYFVDERLNRSDLRADPTTGAVKEGVPLALAVKLSQLSSGACTPLLPQGEGYSGTFDIAVQM